MSRPYSGCGQAFHPRTGCEPCGNTPVRDGDPAHGTPARYDQGCRCSRCRQAKAVRRHGPNSPAAIFWATQIDGPPVIDWDALDHLRPGHTLRVRA